VLLIRQINRLKFIFVLICATFTLFLSENVKALSFHQTQNIKIISDDLDELQKQAFAYLQSGNWEKANEIFAKILLVEPRSALTLYGNAIALFNLKIIDAADTNLETAIEVLEKTNANNSLLADSLVLSAIISAVKNDNLAAVTKLQNAVKIVPNHFDANFSLGRAYFGNNDLNNALIYFRKAVEIEPKSIKAHFFLATTAERAGSSDDALKEYRGILELNPNSVDGNLGLGVLLIKIQGEKSIEGLTALQKAVSLNQNQYESRVALGKVLISLNRAVEAIEHLQRATELESENPEPYYQLARAYKKIGKKVEAENILQKVKMIHQTRRGVTIKNT
jgi:tetratricopeptide (TPR) repeat protein